ncbi:hypothetical protein ACFHW2_11920 [Actinomadura sp. LOL_016]|uniref:hypothetical protein n=1 Tax=unclassified Actinomadura TaxID=2626254 RepID=UPI003A80135F
MDTNSGDIFAKVTLHLIAAYGIVMKALQNLPLPIEVPAILGTHYDAEIADRLVRSLDLLVDIPMGDEKREAVRALVIDWLVARDYLFQAEEDLELWKLDFTVTQITRVHARWKRIQEGDEK